jgi:uncharacterized protein (TIGR01732 family)
MPIEVATNHNKAYAAEYEKSQALSQFEECGDGVLPLNILCQNLVSALQGDGNAVNIIGVQSASSSDSEPSVPSKETHVFYSVLNGLQIPPSQGGPINTPGAGFSVLKFSDSEGDGAFVLILVLFILLVIIGAGFGTAHLHLGKPGQVGSEVLTLCGDEVSCADASGLAQRSFTSADLEGPLEGKPMSALIKEIMKGNVYIDVHTPEHPDGEIRGQILVP